MKNLGFGIWKYYDCYEEIGLRQVEHGFSSFFPKKFFGIFDDFSKWRAPKGALRSFEKSSNMSFVLKKGWQKMKKSLLYNFP